MKTRLCSLENTKSMQNIELPTIGAIQEEIIEEYHDAVRPYDYKLLIAGDNADFASTRQQDALEYLLFFFDKLEK